MKDLPSNEQNDLQFAIHVTAKKSAESEINFYESRNLSFCEIWPKLWQLNSGLFLFQSILNYEILLKENKPVHKVPLNLILVTV